MPSFYALGGDWVEPTDTEELISLLSPIRSWLKIFTVVFDPPDDIQATIDWRLLRDEILPDSNEFIEDALRFRYQVPLRKTESVVGGVPTRYERHLVQLGSTYVAWRIENYMFSAGQNPNLSEYGKFLEAQMNQMINEIVTDKVRLRGQRLKGTHRTVNPRFEPSKAMDQVRTGDQSPGITQSGVNNYDR